MPQKNEKVFPVPITPEADVDLKTIVARTGLRSTDVLRYNTIAGLRAMASAERIALPIEFVLSDNPKPRKKA